MSCDFKMEVSTMAVLRHNYFISVCCKEIGITIVGINKSSDLLSFTMWDNSVQDSYQEFK